MEYNCLSLNQIADNITEKISLDDISTLNYISTENMIVNKEGVEEASKLPNTKKVNFYRKKDILVSNIRPYFKKIWQADNDGGASADILIYRANQNYIDEEYLYYFLSQDSFFDFMVQTSKGTKMPRGDKNAIANYEVSFPKNIVYQRKVASIGRTIDEKIKLNKKTIANLEELSQTLFKRWFIDFEFPDENGNPYKSSGGGMVNTFSRNIPENWDVLELKELLTNTKNNIKPGEYTKTHPYVPIDLIPMKKLNFYEYKDGCEAKSSLLKFDKNDILLGSMRVYFHRVSLAPYSGTTRSTVFVLKPKHEYLTYYLLHFINQKDFISFASNSSSGSTIPYAVWNDTLENYLTILPSKKVLDDFNNRVKNLFDISQNLLLENKNLIELRDSLLPKLMSGEIELPDELEVDEHAELLQ